MQSQATDGTSRQRAVVGSTRVNADATGPVDASFRRRSVASYCSQRHSLRGLLALVGVLVVCVVSFPPHVRLRAGQSVQQRASAIWRQLTRFEVNQTELDNVDTVAVSFAYEMPQPQLFDGDQVRAYCVSAVDELAHRVFTADEAMDAVATGGTGSGVVTVGPLVNMRCSWLLRFVTERGIVLGESTLLRFKHGPTQPLQVRLALTQKSDEMRVKWVSDDVPRPVVYYGQEKDKLNRLARATQSSYEAQDMCREPATLVAPTHFRHPGQIFDAVMTNLEAGKQYFYQVGDEMGKLSDVHEFRMPPAVGRNSAATDVQGSSMSFFVYGDMNNPASATGNFAEDSGRCGTTMALVREEMDRAAADPSKHRYVAIMHVGDLAYAMGSTYVWDQFGHLIEPVAARLPYMVSIGNHDYGYVENKNLTESTWPPHLTPEEKEKHGQNSRGECGVPSEKRFHMPDNGNGIYWYSFDTGLAHHAVVSSEHDVTRGSHLRTWLVNDLKSVDRAKTPWVFLYIHRPMYCSVVYSGDYNRSLLIRDELEQELADYHVDIVFTGHYHSYERTCAVFGDRCIDSTDGKAMAPVHLMVGSGGFEVDNTGYYDVDWREQGFLEYGHGRTHIYNSTHLHFEFVSNAERRVKDETWIVSTHDWPSKRERFAPKQFPA